MSRNPPTRVDAFWQVPPQIDLVGSSLEWSTNDGDEVAAPEDLLGRFISLSEVDEDADFQECVLAFARKWGPLHLCSHGKPETHVDRIVWSDLLNELGTDASPCYRGRGLRLEHDPATGEAVMRPHWEEPTDAWRRYTEQAKAMVRVAMILKGELITARPNQIATVGDWVPLRSLLGDAIPSASWLDRVAGFEPEELPPRPKSTSRTSAEEIGDRVRLWERQCAVIEERNARAMEANARLERTMDAERATQRHMLSAAVGEWLHLGSVGLEVDWSSGGRDRMPDLTIGISSMFGVLAVQLAMVVAGRGSLYFCSQCISVFDPGKSLSPGAPRYCASCKRVRNSKARQAKRVKQQLEQVRERQA